MDIINRFLTMKYDKYTSSSIFVKRCALICGLYDSSVQFIVQIVDKSSDKLICTTYKDICTYMCQNIQENHFARIHN